MNASTSVTCAARPARHRRIAAAAAIILGVAVVHPPHGLGIPLCMTRLFFHLDCPGCGITRSMSCAVRGMWRESLAYHPFGFVMVALCVVAILYGLLPDAVADRIRVAQRSHPGFVRLRRRTLQVLMAAFVIHGAVRMIAEAVAL